MASATRSAMYTLCPMPVSMLIFRGDVGPMSITRRPSSDFSRCSSAFQLLECLGTRGPVSDVGEDRSGPEPSRLNKLRITFVVVPQAAVKTLPLQNAAGVYTAH